MKNALTQFKTLSGRPKVVRTGWQIILMALCALCAVNSACSKNSESASANIDRLNTPDRDRLPAPEAKQREGVPGIVSPSMQALIENAVSCDVFFLEEEAYSEWSNTSRTNQDALMSCLERLKSGTGVFARQQLKDVDLQTLPALLYLGIGHGGSLSDCFLPEVALHFRRGGEEALVLLCFSCNCILILEESSGWVEKHALGAGQELRQRLYALFGRLDLIK